MNFDEFQAAFVKENRRLKLILVIALVLFSVLTLMLLFDRGHFIISSHDIFNERPLSSAICLEGIKGIAQGEPHKHLVTEALMTLLDKEAYQFQIDEILVVQSIELEACRLVLKTDQKLKSLKITLDKNDAYPFYYKIIRIDELANDSEVYL
jgi:hypothetical protein